MKEVFISEKIRNLLPQTKIGYIQADVKYEKYNSALWQEIEKEIEKIRKNFQLEIIKEIPQILYSRKAYKKLGKDPARYRLSAEALYRRIVKDRGLYQISNLVDTINLSSLRTGFSIGGYDYNKIEGDKIFFDVGSKDYNYLGVGRGVLNIENMPVFIDEKGAFGSPTSDSERTKIDFRTNKILLLVVNFGTNRDFMLDLESIVSLLENFCYGKNIKVVIFG